MCTGIIVATDLELSGISNIIGEKQIKQIYDLEFTCGKLNSKDVVIVKCGIGKVNAARTTQILIDKFETEKIINIGSAGGISHELNIKDIVIGEKLTQYDFDLSELDDVEKGEIQGIGKYIMADEKLINQCKENAKISEGKIIIGTIASADRFCTDKQLAKEIREEFHADCVEMEGAAVAQVCLLNKISFLVIRGISDTINGNNKIDYYEYCETAARQAVEILRQII